MTQKDLENEGGFETLGLGRKLLKELAALGYEEPTPIQRETIPLLLEGRDLLGQAATGTGKTAAFALPVLELLSQQRDRGEPLALVLVPTRELAVQVAEAVHRYGRGINAQVLPIYGGQAIVRQLRALERGVDVVVATPGRALDHIRRGTLQLDGVRVVILDEADEMLDMGFAEDIDAVLGAAPAERQTVLFSATMPPRIAAIAKRHLREPARIEIARTPLPAGERPRVRQNAYVVARGHKLAALGRILDVEAPASALVFCRMRTEVDELTEALNARGYRSEALHGGMSQEQRDRVMKKLRSGAAELLIATDVAARGLDIEQLTHVINYDLPTAAEAYVHRIGRVGRAGREGVAITLMGPREHHLLKNIERLTRQRVEVNKLPTVADLRARRLELTRAAIEQALQDEEALDHFRVVVEALADEFDVVDIAAAAVRLADEATRGELTQEEDIPEPVATRERKDGKGERGGKERKDGKRERAGKERARKSARSEGMTRIFIGAGRKSGIRPQDLVGAIANEAGISSREIGAIEIADRFSLVEIAEHSADDVIGALRASALKGKRVTVRRER